MEKKLTSAAMMVKKEERKKRKAGDRVKLFSYVLCKFPHNTFFKSLSLSTDFHSLHPFNVGRTFFVSCKNEREKKH